MFGEGGVDFASPQATGRIAWAALTDVREDARTVVLLRDRILVAYAPVAAFGPPERRAEVVAVHPGQARGGRGGRSVRPDGRCHGRGSAGRLRPGPDTAATGHAASGRSAGPGTIARAHAAG